MLSPEIVSALAEGNPANFAALETIADLQPGLLESIKVSRLMMAWVARSMQGDVRALLAHPKSRQALELKARGKRCSFAAVAGFSPPRQAKNEAVAILKARIQRHSDRLSAEAARFFPPNRYAIRHLAKLKARAVQMGEYYHRNIKSLYQSKRAGVAYGKGGQEGEDRDAYSNGYRKKFGGATWQNAGARLDDEARPTCVIVENFRGTEVARLPLK